MEPGDLAGQPLYYVCSSRKSELCISQLNIQTLHQQTPMPLLESYVNS